MNSKNKKRTDLALLGLASLIVIVIVFFVTTPRDGIHDISSGAVYIAGEVCVINSPLSKTTTTLQNEFNECLRIHQEYVLAEHVKKVSH